MALRRLGHSELMVSSIALGCWPIAGVTSLDVNPDDSLKTLHAAIDAGVNFMDTAYAYGIEGESECLIGQAIRGRRKDVVIATKGGLHRVGKGQAHDDRTVRTHLRSTPIRHAYRSVSGCDFSPPVPAIAGMG
jgi:aryl-alcohol dehydrogenase-like predicted oxidoreductase